MHESAITKVVIWSESDTMYSKHRVTRVTSEVPKESISFIKTPLCTSVSDNLVHMILNHLTKKQSGEQGDL